jgi:hypothetical protein
MYAAPVTMYAASVTMYASPVPGQFVIVYIDIDTVHKNDDFDSSDYVGVLKGEVFVIK